MFFCFFLKFTYMDQFKNKESLKWKTKNLPLNCLRSPFSPNCDG